MPQCQRIDADGQQCPEDGQPRFAGGDFSEYAQGKSGYVGRIDAVHLCDEHYQQALANGDLPRPR
jgi:hypothetical protein